MGIKRRAKNFLERIWYGKYGAELKRIQRTGFMKSSINGETVLISQEKRKRGWSKGRTKMNKVQKTIIIIALVAIFFSVIYPPYIEIQISRVVGSGWDWLFNFNFEERMFVQKRVRYEILICEIIALLVLAGISLLIAKREK